jgi:ribokinase
VHHDILVLGSANADLVVHVDRRPGPGETVLGSETVVLPGGKGANTAVAASRLGARVALLGAVGSDSHAELLLASLRLAGVDVSLVRRSDRPTGIAFITVTADGENSIIVSAGANAALSTEDVDRADVLAARVLVASLEVPSPVVEHAVALAVSGDVRPVVNLSPVTEVSERILSALDPLVVNEHEAGWLVGDGEVDPRRLLALGPRSVVITLGARGAVLACADDGVVHEVGAPVVEPVDTTGAGDAFTGALAVSLASGASLVAAADLAVRVAAVSVTKPGAQPSYPTAAQL